jgi:6-phosphogluconolactonase (cycloisomerase 2 family)
VISSTRSRCPGTDTPSPSSMPMAVTPDHRFLYAALRSHSFPVSSFAIDPTSGRLTHLATTPLQDSMAYIVTDRTGRHLLGASYPGAKLTINPIDRNGHVVEKTTQIIPDRPKAHCILVDPNNRYCYAPILAEDVISQWKFDAGTGRLSPSAPGEIHTKPGAGPRHLAFHPNGRFLYLITETMHTIGAYAIDPRVWDIEGVAIRRRIAGRFQGTACRRRSARDAGRPVSLWQRAPDQHPRGLSHRLRNGNPVTDRAFRDRKNTARLCN